MDTTGFAAGFRVLECREDGTPVTYLKLATNEIWTSEELLLVHQGLETMANMEPIPEIQRLAKED